MSHVSECIALYRDDPLVSNEEYGRIIEDAQARDLDAATLAEAPEPEPAEPETTRPDPTEVAARLLAADRKPGPNAEPELVVAYVLSVLDVLTETTEQLAKGIGYLNDLDTRRADALATLSNGLKVALERIDLRAEETDALSKRLESLTRIVATRTEGLA